ncbi:MAG TPA: AI-2E family transporter [Candidatus Binataceae bacterium]|nr:AI-2E family transporter [Candidatus Binataceae bacterium]
MDHERIVQLFFFGLLALMAYELYQVLGPFLIPIAWAALLAFMVHPLFEWLNRHVRSRSLVAVIITVGVTLLIILPALWLLGRLAAEAQNFYNELSVIVNRSSSGQAQASHWLTHTRIGIALNRMLARRGIRLEDEISKLAYAAAKLTSDYVVLHASYVARNVITAVIDFGIMLITFFYLLRDGNYYYHELRAITPLHTEDKRAIFETLRATLSSVMRGLMLAALAQGLAIGVGYLVCGVPYWAFLALVTAACGLFPFGGTALVWVPVAIYVGYHSGWAWGAGLLVWATLAVAVIDNFLKPIAMRHGMGLPTLVVFFGVAGGLAAYGPLGLFSGPAVISVFVALLRVFRRLYGDEESLQAA